MRINPLILCFLGIVAVSCNEEPALELRINELPQTLWRYGVSKFDADTQLVGIIDAQNISVESYEGQSGALLQERTLFLDSLRGTANEAQKSDTYLRNLGSGVQIFAKHPFEVFDRSFRAEIFDTLAAEEAGGPEFQRFSDHIPGWLTPFSFKGNARFTYNVLNKKRFYVNFRHDADTLSGFVDIAATGIFAGIEQVSVPFDTATVAYRMKTTMEMDWELTVNRRTSLAPYRKTVIMYSWYHLEYGLIKREREPFSLSFPDYQTRFPVLSFPGEGWDLILYIPGIALDS